MAVSISRYEPVALGAVIGVGLENASERAWWLVRASRFASADFVTHNVGVLAVALFAAVAAAARMYLVLEERQQTH